MTDSEYRLFRHKGNVEFKIFLIEKYFKKLSMLEKRFIRKEDILTHVYICSQGIPTIGIGHINPENDTCTILEALNWLKEDLKIAKLDCFEAVPYFEEMPVKRRNAFIEMLFNLGLPRFKKFKKSIAYAWKKQWNFVSIEILDGKWSKQVGSRSYEISMMISTDSNGGK